MEEVVTKEVMENILREILMINPKKESVRSLVIYNTTISHIVAFNYTVFDFNQNLISTLKNKNILNCKPNIEITYLNKKIYSKKFIDKFPILNIKFNLNLINFIRDFKTESQSEIKLCRFILENISLFSKDIKVSICFDHFGIASARFDFNIKDKVGNNKLFIDIINRSLDLTDQIIFYELKKELRSFLEMDIPDELEHDTYPVITTLDSDIDIEKCNKEISGIITLNSSYDNFNENTIIEKTKNKISLYKHTAIIVGHAATLMIFNNPDRFTKNPENYINERINAIEMFHRQKNLIKKLDNDIDELMTELETYSSSNSNDINKLENYMKKIKETQINVQSKLEIYRNTRISITTSFVALFEILNNVFNLNRHYEFVLQKLDVCDSIYQGFYNQRNNQLILGIQWFVVLLGAASIVLIMVGEILFGNDSAYKIFSLLLIILLVVIFSKYIKIFITKVLESI